MKYENANKGNTPESSRRGESTGTRRIEKRSRRRIAAGRAEIRQSTKWKVYGDRQSTEVHYDNF